MAEKIKRVIAVLLSTVLVVALLSPMQNAQADGGEPDTIKLQDLGAGGGDAHNYTYVNRYNDVYNDYVGNADFQEIPEYAYLENNAHDINASQWSYIAFAVNAPEDGQYAVNVQYQLSITCNDFESREKYATFVVNEGGSGNVYKAAWSGANGSSATTDNAMLTLKKGRNVIYSIAFTREMIDGSNGYWANFNWFHVDKRLTIVEQNAQSINTNQLADTNVNMIDKQDGWLGNVNNSYLGDISCENLSQSNIGNVPYFAFTVVAPADGYYQMGTNFTTDKNGNGNPGDYGMAVCVVDAEGIGNIYQKSPHFYNDWDGTMDLSAYLKKGENTVIVTGVLRKQADGRAVWTNFSWPYLRGGLTFADTQKSLFTRLDGKNEYNKINYTEGDERTGGINWWIVNFQGKDALKDHLNTSSNYYVTYYVEAPKDGEYAVRFKTSRGGSSVSANQDVSAVFVNDKDVYLLDNINGFATEMASVALKKGVNVIRCMPWAKDVSIQGDWINYEFAELDPRLTTFKADEVVVNPADAPGVYHYNRNNDGTLGGADAADAKILGLSAESLSYTNVSTVPHMGYMVEAPADGYYDIDLLFSGDGVSDQNTFVLMVLDANGTLEKIETKNYDYRTDGGTSWSSRSHRVNLSIELTAGTHYLMVTMQLPRTEAIAGNYSAGWWTDLCQLRLRGGLKLASEQKDLYQEFYKQFHTLELTEYAFTHGYGTVSENYAGNCWYSGGMTPTDALSEQELKTVQGFDKRNDPYIEYAVKAPKDGTYKVWPDYSGQYGSQYYVTMQVNGKELYHVTKFEPTEVKLTEGNNIIRLIPYTTELLNTLIKAGQNNGWINMHSLRVEKSLTGVKNSSTVLKAAEAACINKYDKGEHPKIGSRLQGAKTGGDVREMTLDALNKYTLGKVSNFSYTVEAPENGYYDINIWMNVDWKYRTGFYMGIVVDGERVQYARIEDVDMMQDDATEINGIADGTVYLTKGTHVLTFTQHLPRTAGEQSVYKENGWSSAWTNFYHIELFGGLKKASEQQDVVVKSDLYAIEAEDSTYAIQNLFGEYDDKENVLQKNESASGGYVLGAGDYNFLPSESSLKTFLNKTDTTYVGFIVDAPADGSYKVQLGYQLWISEFDEYLSEYGKPYAIVKVNDEGFYKAYFGADNGDIYNSELTVSLKKGRNVIYAMFTGDLKKQILSLDKDGYFWANFDCLKVEKKLNPVHKNVVTLEAEKSSYINGFYLINKERKASGGKTIAGANLNDIRDKKYTIADLNSDTIKSVPYFSYTVEAPANGYYDISLSFASEGVQKNFGVVVDGAASYAAAYDNGNHGTDRFDRHSADVSLWLTRGTHVLVFTTEMPATHSNTRVYGWTDFDALTLNGGLKAASQQKNPEDKISMTYLEAETYAYIDKYRDVQESRMYSGGKVVGGANAYGQSAEGMERALDVGEMCYVEYLVDAASNGTYTLKLGVECGANTEFPKGFQPYVYMYVNGTPQKVYLDGARGTVSRVPVTVKLTAGRNVIRVSGIPRNIAEQFNFGIWINHDFLAVPKVLNGVVNTGYTKVEAEASDYIGNFNKVDMPGASGDKVLGNSTLSGAVAGVTTKNLSRDNFDSASYVSFTVNAETTGWYSIAANTQLPGGKAFGRVGLLVDDTAYALKLWQNQWAGKNFCDATIYLEKGTHEVVFTGLLADSFENLSEFDWMDYDFVRFGQGLTLAAKQNKPETATKYTRLEVEKYALANQYKNSNEDGYLSGKFGASLKNISKDVQSFKEIQKDGIDKGKTPYVKYSIVAPEAGSYKVRIGTTYQHEGETKQNYSSYAVLVNGKATEYQVNYFNNVYCRPFAKEVTLDLKKGTNDVIITGFLKDETSDESFAGNNFDYLDVADGLTAEKLGGRVEAEHSEYNTYIPTSELGSSGMMALMSEDWASVYENNMTFKNLTMKKMDNVPWVKYTVIAEKAGTYEVAIGYNSGGSEEVPMEVYTGVIVNDEEIMKTPLRKTWNCSVVVEVELKQGENTILVTGALKDFMNYPDFPAQTNGYGMWIDQDYLDLGPGLKGVVSESADYNKWDGDDDADIGKVLSSVWGDFTGHSIQKPMVAAILVCAVAAGGGLIGFLTRKKKKEVKETIN